MISTKGRYALRVLLDLAEHRNGEFLPMKSVAGRQEISLKYIERILPVLVSHGFVESSHGKGGGYRLAVDPAECRVGDILRATEGDIAPVACLAPGAAPCPRVAGCRTVAMWQRYYDLTNRFFDGITLADLLQAPDGGEYVI